ncbi:MAG: agmatine deiminase family protein [Hyphococcus sp.]
MANAFRQPAEWAAHEAVWIGWPSDHTLWKDDLGLARAEIEDFIRAILFPETEGAGAADGVERVDLVVRGADARAAAEIMRSRLPLPDLLRIHEAPIGDIWLRDTGPIFGRGGEGRLEARSFRFNGWGGKYQLPEDDRIAGVIASLAGTTSQHSNDVVCEGGALETDGEGTFITTRQCLLNSNRNPGMSQQDVEAALKAALGAERVIWLDEGLAGDHTDGHVDNIARFVGPGRVVCMRPSGDDDPNAATLAAIEKTLNEARDAGDRRLEVATVPSPGRAALDGGIAAASHLNFYIANRSLIMPCYGRLTGDHDRAAEAVEILQAVAPRAHVFAIDASHLLSGGGSFHCICQQQPAL